MADDVKIGSNFKFQSSLQVQGCAKCQQEGTTNEIRIALERSLFTKKQTSGFDDGCREGISTVGSAAG
jgi:hypothetical protein